MQVVMQCQYWFIFVLLPPPLPLPLQASVYVMSLLFSLCQEISRVGGHAIDRYIQFQAKVKAFFWDALLMAS